MVILFMLTFRIHTISEISSSNITLWPLPIPLTCSSSASLGILSFHQNLRCTDFVKIYHCLPPILSLAFRKRLGFILSNLLPFHLKTIWLSAHLSLTRFLSDLYTTCWLLTFGQVLYPLCVHLCSFSPVDSGRTVTPLNSEWSLWHEQGLELSAQCYCFYYFCH